MYLYEKSSTGITISLKTSENICSSIKTLQTYYVQNTFYEYHYFIKTLQNHVSSTSKTSYVQKNHFAMFFLLYMIFKIFNKIVVFIKYYLQNYIFCDILLTEHIWSLKFPRIQQSPQKLTHIDDAYVYFILYQNVSIKFDLLIKNEVYATFL